MDMEVVCKVYVQRVGVKSSRLSVIRTKKLLGSAPAVVP